MFYIYIYIYTYVCVCIYIFKHPNDPHFDIIDIQTTNAIQSPTRCCAPSWCWRVLIWSGSATSFSVTWSTGGLSWRPGTRWNPCSSWRRRSSSRWVARNFISVRVCVCVYLCKHVSQRLNYGSVCACICRRG